MKALETNGCSVPRFNVVGELDGDGSVTCFRELFLQKDSVLGVSRFLNTSDVKFS